MRVIYEDIRDHILNNMKDGLPVIPHIQVWNNQVEHMNSGDGYSFPLPAIFIEVRVTGINALNGQYQEQKDLEIVIHYVHEYYHGENMEENLDVFDFADTVFALIKGLKPTRCSTLTRIDEELDTNHTNIYHYQQTFATSYVDISAEPSEIETKVGYTISKTLKEKESDIT